VKLGAWDVRIISAGTFRLDGGAMFGTVPKVVWDKLCPADAQNTILLATNCLLLRGEAGTVLVDTGNGDKESDAFMARFQLEGRGVLTRNLAREGVRPEDIDRVVLTHLHFDHAGGATALDAQGRPVPAFPRARYVVQQRDLDNARSAHLRERASYLPANWEPLEAAGVLDTIRGPQEILPGLSLLPMPGHTPGLQAVLVHGGRKLIYPTDTFPTSHHIQPAWVCGYDLDVTTCVRERIKLLDQFAGTDGIIVFYHDPAVPAGTVGRDAKGRYVVTPV
jgi:glyoxylase-like metal-dependent hydrolase (beta-lactamase superfamily II)